MIICLFVWTDTDCLHKTKYIIQMYNTVGIWIKRKKKLLRKNYCFRERKKLVLKFYFTEIPEAY